MRHSLVSAYRHLHEIPRSSGVYWFSGYSIEPYVDYIGTLVGATGAATLLDYGCGKGLQYTEKGWHEAWGGIMPALYDPAVSEFSVLPAGKFDGVICCDVLEHIPEDELDETIAELVALSRLWCFVTVCCRPSDKKLLPDGRNVHVTVRPQQWWKAKLKNAFAGHARLRLQFTP